MTTVCLAPLDEAAGLIPDLPPELVAAAETFGEKRRKTYLSGRALLRFLLQSRGLCPELPEIAASPEGKPHFPGHPEICFNISHSGEMLALAVGNTAQGIDIERVRARKNQDGLERRVLSDEERAWLSSADESARAADFCMLWTLRECLLKLSGRGLGGLDDVRVFPRSGCLIYAPQLQGSVYCQRTQLLLGERYPGWLSVFSENAAPDLCVLEGGRLISVNTRWERSFTLSQNA